MKRMLVAMMAVALVVAGCGGVLAKRYKYDILRDQQRLPNPPKEKVRVLLKGQVDMDSIREALQEDVVKNCYRSLKGPELVTPENASFQDRPNPFVAVTKDEPYDLEIVGKITTDHTAQKGGGGGGGAGEDELGSQRVRPLNFLLRVMDVKTKEVIFEENFTKMFPPSQAHDGEMMTAIFLAFILNGGII